MIWSSRLLKKSLSGHAEAAARDAQARALTHHIKSVVGISARVTVNDPGGVERSAGKARRVVDKRSQG